MRKTFFIIFISFFISGNVFAKEILLKCIYTSGFTVGEDRDESSYEGKVEFIKLNTKDKKIIDAPNYYGVKETKEVDRFLFWDEDEIWWGEANKNTLIRRTGRLTRDTGVFEEKTQMIINETPYWEQNKYLCEISKKKKLF